jgi:hypothetical protein
MARKEKVIKLTETERIDLQCILNNQTHKLRKIIRVKTLLLIDSKKTKAEIMKDLGISSNQYHLIKRRFFQGGIKAAIEELPRSGQPLKLTENLEINIISIVRSKPPSGSNRWTLQLIKEQLEAINETLCKESIRKVLVKLNSNLI